MPGKSVTAQRPTRMARLGAGRVEYRLERRDGPAVVVLHGGHMHAGFAPGEQVLAELGYTVLAPSRPGYGRTPVATAVTHAGFADVTRQLCAHLGIDEVAAVMGVSAGGRTAVALAARYPELVRRLILTSALSSLPWPDRRTRVAGNVVFRWPVEKVTWSAVRTLLRVAPQSGLRLLLGSLSTESGRDAVATLARRDRVELIAQFHRMRSGRGFVRDMRPAVDLTAQVTQPSLVIASRRDAGVPFVHAEALAARIAAAELVDSGAASHLFWVDPGYEAVAERIAAFLAPGSTRSLSGG